jgi:23S rRNA pseudouridine2605 synthase
MRMIVGCDRREWCHVPIGTGRRAQARPHLCGIGGRRRGGRRDRLRSARHGRLADGAGRQPERRRPPGRTVHRVRPRRRTRPALQGRSPGRPDPPVPHARARRHADGVHPRRAHHDRHRHRRHPADRREDGRGAGHGPVAEHAEHDEAQPGRHHHVPAGPRRTRPAAAHRGERRGRPRRGAGRRRPRRRRPRAQPGRPDPLRGGARPGLDEPGRHDRLRLGQADRDRRGHRAGPARAGAAGLRGRPSRRSTRRR